ncbi:DUF4397 domain-containing protein [Pedobacter miscanthi]|uniref:DUF4397 domain-containing protein n=1 Tax=Pedobacter miscanthi TaxID=2259170 RepID=A0A366L5I1_9SPHI|nr:DUF4397 domain-containing protein [Pedobacter miscanthi]RBQ08749.1 hypothetical protein DRW42_08570 [Pedobacter miscanthi]
MKNTRIIFSMFFMALPALMLFSCIKNDNFIKGDAKIRYFHAAVTDTTQNFYLKGIQSGASTTYGSNSNYIVVAGDSTYTITSRNINTGNDLASTPYKFEIGANYSIFYTHKTLTDPPVLTVYKDDVKQNLNVAKLTFLNLGYTLGSDVIIKDEATVPAFTQFTMKYGDMVSHSVNVNKTTKISFTLTTPISTQPPLNTLDSLTTTPTNTNPSKSLAITKGLVYTVLLDGSKKGELQMRLISAN